MKLILESEEFINKLNNNLVIPLLSQNMKQLRGPLDPKLIIWDALREPIEIKLEDQIYTPIDNQLENIHI